MLRELCRNAVALLLPAASMALAGCGSMTGVAGVPYVSAPSANEPLPGVIVLHASGGREKHHVDFARRLSDHGYVTAVVNCDTPGGVDNIDRAHELLTGNPAVRPRAVDNGPAPMRRGVPAAVEP